MKGTNEIKAHRNQYKCAIKKVIFFLRSTGRISGSSPKHSDAIKLFADALSLKIECHPNLFLLGLYLSKTCEPLVTPLKNKKVARKKVVTTVKGAYKIKGSSGLYMITCLVNNKIYIGSSSNIEARWLWHKMDLKNKIHHNSRLQADFNAFGEEKLKFEVLWSGKISRNDLYFLEQRCIDELNPDYNIQKEVYVPPLGARPSFARHRKVKKSKLHL